MLIAWVAKLVDAPGLGPDGRKAVPVRVRPQAPSYLYNLNETSPRLRAFFRLKLYRSKANC